MATRRRGQDSMIAGGSPWGRLTPAQHQTCFYDFFRAWLSHQNSSSFFAVEGESFV
jgi:hypothetical protein